MKKRLSLLIALVMLIAFVLPTIAACSKDEVVTKIEVVDAQTEFYLGDNNVIDYDNLKLKVTFEEGDPVTKTVKEWGATHTTADLSKEGATSYTVTYGGKSCVVNITVKVRDVQPSNQVTVTLHYNDGATADYSYSVEKGNKIQLTTPGYTNHTFGGWYTVNGGTSTEDSAWGTKWTADMTVNENLHLYARWTENAKVQFDVAFNNGSQVEHKTVDAGSTVTFPTEPTREDYHFDGWYTKDGTDDDWGEQWDEDDLVTGNLNLYAKWTAIAYSNFQFFYLDDGDHTDISAKVEKGQSLGDKLPTPDAREGYRFDGWYTKNGTTDGQWGDKWLATTPATENTYNLYARWIVTKATVTFNYNYPAGQNPDNVVVVFDNIDEHTTLGDKLPAGTDKAPEHYTFAGWFTDRTNGTQVDANTPVTQNVTYYAHWSHKTVTVTFDYNGNGTDNLEKTVNEGATLGQNWPADPSWANHRFVGWYDEQTEGGTQYTANTAIATDKTLYARWVETATVTFDLNGADGTPHDPVTVDKGQSLGANNWPTDPTRQGYRFDGWYTKTGDALDTTKWSATTTTTGNTTLYAKWVQQVTVKFDLNYEGAKDGPDSQTVDINGTITLPANVSRPESDNKQYTFAGWYTKDGKTEEGTKWENTTPVTADMTLYAKWNEASIPRKVTYHVGTNGSLSGSDNVTVNQGDTLTLPQVTPNRGYKFDGWFTDESAGEQWTNQTVGETDVNLYARYSELTKYTVTFDWNFDGQDDTVVTDKSGSEKGLYSGEKVNIPETIDRENYKFDGWYTDESCTEGHKFSDNQVTIGNANVTLYAKWVGQVTVYFSTGIEDVDSEVTAYHVITVTVDVNKQISISDVKSQLERADYYAEFAKGNKFLGWFDDQIGGNAQDGNYSVGDVPGYKYFYAHWQVRTVTIVLDYNLMDESERLFVDWGTVVDLSEHVPTLKGYVFAGWYSDKENQTDATKKETIEAKPDNAEIAITLYAKWNHSVRVNIILGNGQPNIGAEVPTGATFINDLVYNGILDKIKEQGDTLGKGNEAKSFVQTAWPWAPGSLGYYYDAEGESDLGEVLKAKLTDIVKKYLGGNEEGAVGDLRAITGKIKMILDTKSQPVTRAGYTHGALLDPSKILSSDNPFCYWYHFVSGKHAPWPIVLNEDAQKVKNYIIDSDLFLYAQWTEDASASNVFNVTLHFNNEASETFTTKVSNGGEYNPPTPKRNGYIFAGWWDKDGTGGDWGNPWTENKTVTAETHLYAKWTADNTVTYLVTLSYNGEVQNFVISSGTSLNTAAQSSEALKNFLAKATTWYNGSKTYDLSTPVTGNLYLVGESKEALKGLVMSFSAPDSYNSYKQRSTNTGDSLGYFKKLNQVYEVGTVNKFIFRPIARIKPQGADAVYDYNPTTTATVEFRKESETFENSSLKTHNLTRGNTSDWVKVDNNTYKFEDIADGTFVRLTVSLDTSSGYSIPSSVQNKVTAEFKLVKGGYNVYDQRGLSVMNDLQKKVWAPLWGATATQSDDGSVTLSAGASPVKLAADENYLYEYVGNVDWVILHNDIDLDPTQMPQDFFWQEGDPLYYAAYQSLAGWPRQQEKLIGSLKDGDNSGVISGEHGYYSYCRVLDHKADIANNGATQPDTGLGLNMQKGFYATCKVSVSGNYFSLTHILERGGRLLQVLVDYETSTKVGDPVPHWSVFQLLSNTKEGTNDSTRGHKDNHFTVKNIAMKGSTPQKDYYDQGKTIYFAPGGIMLANTYACIDFENINANNFFTAIVGDNYGNLQTAFNVVHSKIYDAYSNMVYTWRGNIVIEDCDMVGSGGPLFILCDGERVENDGVYNTADTGGPTLTVKDKCRLEAYATGAESWYDANNAAALVSLLRGKLETDLFNKVGKTVRWVKAADGTMHSFQGDNTADKDKNQYLNVIAVMICSPGDLINGKDKVTLDVAGKTTFDYGDNPVTFAMHNSLTTTARKITQKDGSKYLLFAQMGDSWLATDLDNSIYPTESGITTYYSQVGTAGKVTASAKSWGDVDQRTFIGSNWMGKSADAYNNKVCIYLSAGAVSGSAGAPYFGAILDIGDYAISH